MPIDENQDYVKPVPTREKLKQYLQENNLAVHPGESQIIIFLCGEIDRLEERLDYFHTIKADKKEQNYRARRPKPHHFRGTRD